MKEIDIQITKGQVKSFSVELCDGLPSVSATIALFTANNKEISSFTISTNRYYNSRFELPVEMINPIVEIGKRLEAIVINECNKKMAMIAVNPEKE